MGWLYLLLASLLEIGFTTTLRLSDGFKNLPATAGFIAFVGLSLFCIELAIRSIPLGTAYAIWTGVGAAGTVVVGIVWFAEPATFMRLLLIAGIIVCAIGLKFA